MPFVSVGGGVDSQGIQMQSSVLCNDEGVNVYLGSYWGPGNDGSSTYYCGRYLGRAAIPGSDGQCGPTAGPQCPSCERLQTALMRRKRFVVFAKMVAGFVRFFFEDVCSGGCQLIYLCKLWKTLTWGARAFTMLSVASGVMTSLMGPLREWCSLREINASLRDARQQPESNDSSNDPRRVNGGAGVGGAKVDSAALHKFRPKVAVVFDHSVASIVDGIGSSKKVRTALVVGAIAFWVTMAVLPFLMPVDCGTSPSANHYFVFFGLTAVSIMLETWIIMQSRVGYLMFKHLRVKLLLGYVLAFLGRFDTFSDVLFAGMIVSCSDITWFSIHEHYFYIPFGLTLAQVVVGVLVIGVFCLQAVPGVLLLACRPDQLATSCKLNEYNVLLAVMDSESHEDNDILVHEEGNIEEVAHVMSKYVMEAASDFKDENDSRTSTNDDLA